MMADDSGGQAPRRRPGQLEAQVLTVLANAARPLTPGEVRELLDPSLELSYSAIVTTLTRLHTKNAVARYRAGRAYRYGALSDAAGLVATKMSKLLTGEPDRAAVLRRFVSGLDDGDEQLLRDLLGDSDAAGA